MNPNTLAIDTQGREYVACPACHYVQWFATSARCCECGA